MEGRGRGWGGLTVLLHVLQRVNAGREDEEHGRGRPRLFKGGGEVQGAARHVLAPQLLRHKVPAGVRREGDGFSGWPVIAGQARGGRPGSTSKTPACERRGYILMDCQIERETKLKVGSRPSVFLKEDALARFSFSEGDVVRRGFN